MSSFNYFWNEQSVTNETHHQVAPGVENLKLLSSNTVNLVLKIRSGYRQVSARNLLNVITSSFILNSRVDSAALQRCEECISNLADACWKTKEWIVAPLNANLSSKIYYSVLRSRKNKLFKSHALRFVTFQCAILLSSLKTATVTPAKLPHWSKKTRYSTTR